mmetsp:Transcript_12748/g.32273  ORF Transcript_12748/g.32273 Transcript_12748/m.32273 type:complete len:200 (+) Transcript_12748:567-1166(+)
METVRPMPVEADSLILICGDRLWSLVLGSSGEASATGSNLPDAKLPEVKGPETFEGSGGPLRLLPRRNLRLGELSVPFDDEVEGSRGSSWSPGTDGDRSPLFFLENKDGLPKAPFFDSFFESGWCGLSSRVLLPLDLSRPVLNFSSPCRSWGASDEPARKSGEVTFTVFRSDVDFPIFSSTVLALVESMNFGPVGEAMA